MWRQNGTGNKNGHSQTSGFTRWNYRHRSSNSATTYKEIDHGIDSSSSSSSSVVTKYYSYIVATERLSIPILGDCAGATGCCMEMTAENWVARPHTKRSRVTRFGHKNTIKVTVTAALQGMEISHSAFRPTCAVYFTKKQFIFNPMSAKYVKAVDLKVGDHVCSKMVNLWRVTSIEEGGYREVVEMCILDRQKYMIGLPQLSVVSFSPYRDHEPIFSYGIIAFRLNSYSVREYLLVQRRDTMAYRDLIRGKYCNRPILEICRTYFEEMTTQERLQIQTWSFEQLWTSIWSYGIENEQDPQEEQVQSNLHYSTSEQYLRAEQKFKALDLAYLSNLVGPSQYQEPEYGFPKGRPTRHESNLDTAMREFTEEVDLDATDRNNVIVVSDSPLEERFVATNGLTYSHTYYLAELVCKDYIPQVNPSNLQQQCEIGSLFFATLDQALHRFRSYDRAKKQVLVQADLVLQDLCKRPS